MSKFNDILKSEITFPTQYTFKFIVPTQPEKLKQVQKLLSGCEVTSRLSKNGKYTSFSGIKLVKSADQIMEVYEKAKAIEGIISL